MEKMFFVSNSTFALFVPLLQSSGKESLHVIPAKPRIFEKCMFDIVPNWSRRSGLAQVKNVMI